jgi:outer membrane protein OmpA-like peptidoglycan-associated protein
MKRFLALAAAASLLVSEAAHAQQAMAFVACPIIRDTESVPCWVTEHDGETYYLGIQTDTLGTFRPPTLGQKALIEGVTSDEPRICGGMVLKDAHAGAVGELGACPKTMLPSEERYQLPFKAPRQPGPNIGKKFKAFDLAWEFLKPEVPVAPFGPKRFVISFEFDGSSFWFDDQRTLIEIIDYAKASNARQIKIVGHRTEIKLDDGTKLTEFEAVAKIRATMTANQVASGQIAAKIDTSWDDVPVSGGASQRIVTIDIIP